MIGVKLQSLHKHLLDNANIASNECNSYMELATLYPLSKRTSPDSIVVGLCQYTAVFELEHCSVLPEVLLALISVWLLEVDNERFNRELPMPTIDIDPVNDKVADIEISLELEEEIQIVEDPNGRILLNGKKYSTQVAVIDEVDEIAVGNDESIPTDLPVVAP